MSNFVEDNLYTIPSHDSREVSYYNEKICYVGGFDFSCHKKMSIMYLVIL